jgi:2-keto-4-pentenoate hydratase/2-oxohepta-3-ene-1,7-dioic acid hydratase in catechol pathway
MPIKLMHLGPSGRERKCCPTFNPMGPGLVLPECVPDPQALGLSTQVNGKPRQRIRK